MFITFSTVLNHYLVLDVWKLFWWICVTYLSHIFIVHVHRNFLPFHQFFSFYWGIFVSVWVILYKLLFLSIVMFLWEEFMLWLGMVFHNRLMLSWQSWFESIIWVLLLISPICSTVMLNVPTLLHSQVEISCFQGTKGVLQNVSQKILEFWKLGYHIWLNTRQRQLHGANAQFWARTCSFYFTGTFKEQMPSVWNKMLLKDLTALLIMVIS